MRGITFIVLIALSALALLAGCSIDLAGGTSTSENGRVIGRIVTADGTSAAATEVLLLPASYNPVSDTFSPITDTTNINGIYRFEDVTPGAYSVQSVQLDSRTRACTESFTIEMDSTVTVTSDTLRSPGSIRIALPAQDAASKGYLYIPGTTISLQLSAEDSFAMLDSVPAGVIESVVHTTNETDEESVLASSVEVKPDETTTILETGWLYQKTVRLNTSPTGAATKTTEYNFPVLIRLNSRNFDFTQAKSDGADLLFTKIDNTPVPHDIERWDQSANVAEIWVLADTLKANSSENILIMHWGNQRIYGKQTTQPVYDTAFGFSAVWHMDETDETVYDATVNRYHGSRIGNLERTAGAIGYGQYFDTSEAFCDMGNILNLTGDSYTISAWVRRDSSGLQTIFAKSDGDTPSVEYGWTISFGTSNILHFFSASAGEKWGDNGAFDLWTSEEPAIADTINWHFIVLCFDRSANDSCRFFYDGVDITETIRGNITSLGSPVNDLSLRIGAEADGDYQFNGVIDECVISHTTRSPEWIRLCYINQSSDDRLVEFE